MRLNQKALRLREKLYHQLSFVLHENGGLTRENMSAANCAIHNAANKPEIIMEQIVKKFENRATVDGTARANIMAGVMVLSLELKNQEPEFFNA